MKETISLLLFSINHFKAMCVFFFGLRISMVLEGSSSETRP